MLSLQYIHRGSSAASAAFSPSMFRAAIRGYWPNRSSVVVPRMSASALIPNPAYAAPEAEVKAAEKGITDLEEEARRAGALPGWLR
jgi:hypothetical protein